MKNNVSRKVFIKNAAIGMLAFPLGMHTVFGAAAPTETTDLLSADKNKHNDAALNINIFSKHLQWLNCKDMAALAADLGFDGINSPPKHRYKI